MASGGLLAEVEPAVERQGEAGGKRLIVEPPAGGGSPRQELAADRC